MLNIYAPIICSNVKLCEVLVYFIGKLMGIGAPAPPSISVRFCFKPFLSFLAFNSDLFVITSQITKRDLNKQHVKRVLLIFLYLNRRLGRLLSSPEGCKECELFVGVQKARESRYACICHETRGITSETVTNNHKLVYGGARI